MKNLVLVFALFAMSCCTLSSGQSKSLPTGSYVKVVKHVFGEPVGTGSGSIVDIQPSGGFVLTAAHVCLLDNQLERIWIKDMSGNRHDGLIIRVNEILDMCIVYAPGLQGEEIVISPVAPMPGDEVFSISSPYGMESIADGMVPIIRGTYSGKVTMEEGLVWDVYSLRIAPGSSGGMIVNRDGQMVGMTHRLFVLGRHFLEYTDISVGAQYEDLVEFLSPYNVN